MQLLCCNSIPCGIDIIIKQLSNVQWLSNAKFRKWIFETRPNIISVPRPNVISVQDQKKLGMTPPYKLGLKAHVISSLSFSKKILKMKSENMTWVLQGPWLGCQKNLGMTPPYNLGLKTRLISSLLFFKK